MQDYVRALNKFYREHPACYEMDYNPDGFTWINNISADENMLVFTRNTKKKEETLLVVLNFSPLTYEKHKIGVPYPGKYKEIFNSDKEEFGGSGVGNPRVKQSKKDECDGRPDSIAITVPPMSVTIFSYTKTVQKAKTNQEAKEAIGQKDSKVKIETLPAGKGVKAEKAEDARKGKTSVSKEGEPQKTEKSAEKIAAAGQERTDSKGKPAKKTEKTAAKKKTVRKRGLKEEIQEKLDETAHKIIRRK